jgi:hypothetical protein
MPSQHKLKGGRGLSLPRQQWSPRNEKRQPANRNWRTRTPLQIITNRMNNHVTMKQRSRNSSICRIRATNTVGVIFRVGIPYSKCTNSHALIFSRHRRQTSHNVTLTPHHHLRLKSKICRAFIHAPYTPSWRGTYTRNLRILNEQIW